MNVCIIAQERAHEAAFMVGSQKKRERNAGGREWRGCGNGCENGCGLGAFSGAGWVRFRARVGWRYEPCLYQRKRGITKPRSPLVASAQRATGNAANRATGNAAKRW